MNGFGSLNGNLLQPQLTTINEVPMDGIDLIVNKKKKGATDEMIKEMIDVVGLANQNNKFVAGYQVEIDKIYK